jgi:hypothetical protein
MTDECIHSEVQKVITEKNKMAAIQNGRLSDEMICN